MQRLVALERNYDVTIGVPPLLGEMLRHRFGEHPGDALFVTGHAVVIRRAQRHDVVVGRELTASGQLTNVVLTLTLQCLRHFLSDDIATEHAREGVAYQALQAPIKTLSAAHRAHPPLTRLYFPADPIRVRAVLHGPR